MLMFPVIGYISPLPKGVCDLQIETRRIAHDSTPEQ